MKFSPSNPVWLEIKQWAENEIKKAHLELEQPANSDTTAFTRGRVAMLRELLKAPAGASTPAIPDAPSY